jgi:hypothetical protein
MNHLTMDQLLELREPGREPGLEAARTHLDKCLECQAETDRLAQRMARLRALPVPRPGRDQFPAIRARYLADRRRTQLRWAGLGGLALAASVALAVVLRPAAGIDTDTPRQVAQQAPEQSDSVLQAMMSRSQQLEAALNAYDPDSRVIDGRTAAIAARLEDQLSTIDRQLEMTETLGHRADNRQAAQVRLWRERVGLLDALVDVHLTRASYAGM